MTKLNDALQKMSKELATTTDKKASNQDVPLWKRLQEAKRVKKSLAELPHRICLILDDSGSMAGKPWEDTLEAAKFLMLRAAKDTAFSLHTMEQASKAEDAKLPVDLTQDFLKLSTLLYAGYTTPLYTSLLNALKTQQEKKIFTNITIITDGAPTDYSEDIISGEIFERMRTDDTLIPVDTVYVSLQENPRAVKLLQELSAKAGGIFVKFSSFEALAKGLRYLAPSERKMLANPEIKEKIEKGLL